MKLSETTGYTLCRIARKIHYQVDEIFKPYGITVEQWAALITIEEKAPLSQKQLSDSLEKNQNTVKALINHLLSKGWITRNTDPTDKRNQLLTLTEAGQQITKELSFLDKKANLAFLQTFTPEESQILSKLLSKIEASL